MLGSKLEVPMIDWHKVLGILKRAGGLGAFNVYRTLTHGWLTSARLHEEHALPCPLCAEQGGDSQVHLLFCKTFLRFLDPSENLVPG